MTGRPINRATYWIYAQPTNQPTDLLDSYPIDRPTNQPTSQSTNWLTDQPTVSLAGCQTNWPTDQPMEEPLLYVWEGALLLDGEAKPTEQ